MKGYTPENMNEILEGEEIVTHNLKVNDDGSITIEALVNIYAKNKCYNKQIKIRLNT